MAVSFGGFTTTSAWFSKPWQGGAPFASRLHPVIWAATVARFHQLASTRVGFLQRLTIRRHPDEELARRRMLLDF